jgi:hypothetical protein
MVDDLFDFDGELERRGIFFCFRGPISHEILVELGITLEQRLKQENADSSKALKMFAMVMEMTQNIIHYSVDRVPKENPGMQPEGNISHGIIAIGRDRDGYFILSGNKIKNTEINRMRDRLSIVRRMTKAELKQYYREQRKKSPDAQSKGAGLGFIDLAKRSTRPIEFHFKKIDDEHSFFSLKTAV